MNNLGFTNKQIGSCFTNNILHSILHNIIIKKRIIFHKKKKKPKRKFQYLVDFLNRSHISFIWSGYRVEAALCVHLSLLFSSLFCDSPKVCVLALCNAVITLCSLEGFQSVRSTWQCVCAHSLAAPTAIPFGLSETWTVVSHKHFILNKAFKTATIDH